MIAFFISFYLKLLLTWLDSDSRMVLADANDVYTWSWNWDKNSYAVKYDEEGKKEKVTYSDCEGLCTSDGYQMLDIKDNHEFTAINHALDFDKVSKFWTIGIYDPNDKAFYWRDKLDISNSFWAIKEPKVNCNSSQACVEYKWDSKSKFHKLYSLETCNGLRTCLCKKTPAPELRPQRSTTEAPESGPVCSTMAPALLPATTEAPERFAVSTTVVPTLPVPMPALPQLTVEEPLVPSSEAQLLPTPSEENSASENRGTSEDIGEPQRSLPPSLENKSLRHQVETSRSGHQVKT